MARAGATHLHPVLWDGCPFFGGRFPLCRGHQKASFCREEYIHHQRVQRETAAAVRVAEKGALVTITRHDRPVVHVISDERLGAMLETMELLADPTSCAN